MDSAIPTGAANRSLIGETMIRPAPPRRTLTAARLDRVADLDRDLAAVASALHHGAGLLVDAAITRARESFRAGETVRDWWERAQGHEVSDAVPDQEARPRRHRRLCRLCPGCVPPRDRPGPPSGARQPDPSSWSTCYDGRRRKGAPSGEPIRKRWSPRTSGYGPCVILNRATIECEHCSRARSTAPQARRSRSTRWLLPSTQRTRVAHRASRGHAARKQLPLHCPRGSRIRRFRMESGRPRAARDAATTSLFGSRGA